MPLDFPDAPSLGQVYGQWTWNGTAWVSSRLGAGTYPVGGVLFGLANGTAGSDPDNLLFNLDTSSLAIGGTLSLGVPLAIASGGTAATAAAQALANLGGLATTGGVMSGTLTVTASGGEVISNNSSALPAFTTGQQQLRLAAADGNSAYLLMDSFGAANANQLKTRAARGSALARTATQNNDVLFSASCDGTSASNTYSFAGNLYLFARETWSATARGTGWSFNNVAPGTTTIESPLVIGRGLVVGGNMADDTLPGVIAAVGPLNALSFQQRGATRTWQWYAPSATNEARLFSGGTGDRIAWDATTGLCRIYGPLTINDASALKPGGGVWADSSDERTKKNVEAYSTGLEQVLQLNPVTFQHNGRGGSIDDGRVFVGLIANQAKDVMPEMVGVTEQPLDPEDDHLTEILTLDATALIYALVNSVKALAAQIDDLKAGLPPGISNPITH